MKFEKGKAKTGGRAKGTKYKATVELCEAIDQAFDELGGVKYLVQQAKKNPQAFLTLLGKRLPKDINHGGQDGNPVMQEIVLKIVDVNPPAAGN